MSKINLPKPVISIVVPVLNQSAKTVKCFHSIRTNTKLPYEIIWVDNGSNSTEFNIIRRQATRPRVQCKVVKNTHNKGFVKATNQGIKEAVGEYVALLNNDTEVTWKWASKLIKPFMKDPKVGVVGPITQSKIAWQEASWLNRRWDLKLPVYKNHMEEYVQILDKNFGGQYIDVGATPLSFFCAVFRRSIFKELGGLDERISIGLGEDDGFCARLKAYGYKIMLSLGTFVFHHHRTTFNALKLGTDSLRRHNIKVLKRIKSEVMEEILNKKEQQS